MDVPINYLAVLVAAVASMILGALWYGPLFGKKWIAYMGWSPELSEEKKKGAGKGYAIQFIASLVMSYVLAHALVFASSFLDVSGVTSGLSAGFWNWLGFVAPVTLGGVLWEGKSWGFWLLNNGYYLCSLLVMGMILAMW